MYQKSKGEENPQKVTLYARVVTMLNKFFTYEDPLLPIKFKIGTSNVMRSCFKDLTVKFVLSQIIL